MRYVLDRSVRSWANAAVIAGGSPWSLMRLHRGVRVLVDRLSSAGPGGAAASGDDEAVIHRLVDRGVVHPRRPAAQPPHDVTVVIPAYGRAEQLDRTLASLTGLDVVVVDDGTPLPSPVEAVARRAGARYVRLPENQGPAAARNAGVATVSTRLVALVDSDCEPEAGWLDALVPYFADPRVAVVAPRVVARPGAAGLLARFEASSSALDMGRRSALVRPGSRLAFVPSATLLARTATLKAVPFDPGLRLGEDVDLVWRLADSGAHVRYEPDVRVYHAPRGGWREWAHRRFEYGTSAAALDARHPGRLTPLRVSPWSVGVLVGLATRRGGFAAGTGIVAGALLARRLGSAGIDPTVAAHVVAAGVAADGIAVGHALRREYWPLGAALLATSPWSRASRVATALMLGPVLAEWVRERPDVDPFRYGAIRLLGDAAYGSGVIVASLRARTARALRPGLRRRPRGAARP